MHLLLEKILYLPHLTMTAVKAMVMVEKIDAFEHLIIFVCLSTIDAHIASILE
jgi:hypothetical protein